MTEKHVILVSIDERFAAALSEERLAAIARRVLEAESTPACEKLICRSSRISGRNSAMPPKVSIWKPWQTMSRTTVVVPSRFRGSGEGAGVVT